MSIILFSGGSAPQPTREERKDVRANFCNIDDKNGLCIFTAFLPSAVTMGKYVDWMQRLVDAGSNHVTFSPFSNTYNTYPIDNFNWLDQPKRFADLVYKVSETRGANGKAITPILFMDDGSPNPIPRIVQYWPAMADAMAGFRDRLIIVPAWEPVIGDWLSSELSYSLEVAHSLWAESLLGWHGSQKRWVGSSNPVQPSDPWQGGEAIFYKSFGGQYIDIPFYQAQSDAVMFPNCDPAKDDCWLNRWYDGLIRLGNGVNGWRQMDAPICLAEGPAYLAIRGVVNNHDARVWATAGKQMADSVGVRASFMNGLPF